MPHGPRAVARGSRIATSARASAVVASSGLARQYRAERVEHVGGPLGLRDPEVADDAASEREGAPGEARHGGRGEHSGARVEPPAPGAARGLHGEREERQQADRRQQRPGPEGEPRTRVAPRHREPAERERAVDDGGRERHVPERRRRESRAPARARGAEPGALSARRRPRARRARGSARTAAGSRRPRCRTQPALRGRGARGPEARRPRAVHRAPTCACGASRRRSGRGRRGTTNASRSSAASQAAVGRLAGSTERALSTAARSRRGRSPRRAESGGAPDAIVDATSGSGTPQNGWLPARDSHRITPTAQTSLRSEASSPPRRSGEM